VVGEDGLDGIALDPVVAPGSIYQQFHRALLDLHARGVVLALCSKNNEVDVLDVLDRHPASLLRRRHFAAWRINWNNKAQSLRELAAELRLGLDSFVFLDDSPMERDLVRRALPMVAVPEFPQRLSELPLLLPRGGWFATGAVTAEDLARGDSYAVNRDRQQLLADAGSIESYLASLGTWAQVAPATAGDVARVAQLTQKTNQFNLTTRRYTAPEIDAMLADPGCAITTLRAGDRFGDLGLVGVLIARHDAGGARIDSLLLSCRALGRDLEQVFLGRSLALLRDRWGVTSVRGEFRRSTRNEQVADFYARCGFSADATDATGGEFHVGSISAIIDACQRAHVANREEANGK
jgi:FkbH-like protein